MRNENIRMICIHVLGCANETGINLGHLNESSITH